MAQWACHTRGMLRLAPAAALRGAGTSLQSGASPERVRKFVRIGSPGARMLSGGTAGQEGCVHLLNSLTGKKEALPRGQPLTWLGVHPDPQSEDAAPLQ